MSILPISGATYFSLTHLLLFIPSISAISPIVLGTWQKSIIFCSVAVKIDLCSLVQSCRLLCRQQVLKPNSEVYEIGYNFNLGLGESLLAAALHDSMYSTSTSTAGSILRRLFAISCRVASVTFCPVIFKFGATPKMSQPPSEFRNAHAVSIAR